MDGEVARRVGPGDEEVGSWVDPVAAKAIAAGELTAIGDTADLVTEKPLGVLEISLVGGIVDAQDGVRLEIKEEFAVVVSPEADIP